MILLPVLGALLILLLGLDVFLTVFHPRGRGGPINRSVSGLIWSAARTVGRRGDGSKRDGVLALGGPVIVVATLFVWVLLLVTGFALVFYPWVETFLVSPGSLRTRWAEALYYSAYTAATLGLGDIVANSEALRLITVLEAFGGFALLSASVTYFLAVYRELIAMHSLAADIAGLFQKGEEHVVTFTRRKDTRRSRVGASSSRAASPGCSSRTSSIPCFTISTPRRNPGRFQSSWAPFYGSAASSQPMLRPS